MPSDLKKDPLVDSFLSSLRLEKGLSENTIKAYSNDCQAFIKWLFLNKRCEVINTTEGTKSIEDSASIRQSALRNKIFCTTTMFGAFAIIDAFKSNEENWTYSTLQEINK